MDRICRTSDEDRDEVDSKEHARKHQQITHGIMTMNVQHIADNIMQDCNLKSETYQKLSEILSEKAMWERSGRIERLSAFLGALIK